MYRLNTGFTASLRNILHHQYRVTWCAILEDLHGCYALMHPASEGHRPQANRLMDKSKDIEFYAHLLAALRTCNRCPTATAAQHAAKFELRISICSQ